MVRVICFLWLIMLFLLGAQLSSPRPMPRPGVALVRRRAWFAPVGRRVYFVGYVQVT